MKLIISYILMVLVSFINVAYSVDNVEFIVDGFSPNPINLKYEGDAFVPLGSTSLRLTKTGGDGTPVQYSPGRVVYTRDTVTFWEPGKQAIFETTITFKITVDPSVTVADGLTFFIAPVNYPIPSDSTGGNFAIFRSDGTAAGVFAVEFDVYQNDWDPNDRHIGIDIESSASKVTTSFDATGDVEATIRYDPNTNNITVVANSPQGSASLSYVYDLKTILPRQVQVGLSASTGLYVALHDVSYWSFSSYLVSDDPDTVHQDTYIAL